VTQAQTDAVARFAATLARVDTGGLFNHFTCDEIDAFADMLQAFGHDETADYILSQHSAGDTMGERHFAGGTADHGSYDVRGVRQQ
jgi:hypothetical protein